MNPIALAILALTAIVVAAMHGLGLTEPWLLGFVAALGAYAAGAPRIADQWERAVLLRLGRYQGLRGPGLYWVVPLFDRISSTIDNRIRTTTFMAEKTLTKDTVPVDVDAVLFWQVFDPEAAALEVEDYVDAVTWASQTALRDLIGKTDLADMLRGREHMDAELQKIIDERTHAWGVAVRSVEIRDVVIPRSLEDAMSRQAQAERERQARVILGEAEAMIADSFVQAADRYVGHETAFHLRALNVLYEGLKEKGNVMIVPSPTVETMGASGMAGLLALHKQLQLATAEAPPQLPKTDRRTEAVGESPPPPALPSPDDVD